MGGGGGAPRILHTTFGVCSMIVAKAALPPSSFSPCYSKGWYNGTSLAGSFDRVEKKKIMLSTTNPNPTERLFRAGGALRYFAVPINHTPGAAPVSIDEPCYSCSSAASFNSVREPEIHFAYKSCYRLCEALAWQISLYCIR